MVKVVPLFVIICIHTLAWNAKVFDFAPKVL